LPIPSSGKRAPELHPARLAAHGVMRHDRAEDFALPACEEVTTVIPGRREAASLDVQLHVRESILPIVVMDTGNDELI
jgi:hypothetical protein